MRRNHYDDEDDIGRDPRFPAGWWIVPALIIGAIIWAIIVIIAT